MSKSLGDLIREQLDDPDSMANRYPDKDYRPQGLDSQAAIDYLKINLLPFSNVWSTGDNPFWSVDGLSAKDPCPVVQQVRKQCECGQKGVEYAIHSDYCPLYAK